MSMNVSLNHRNKGDKSHAETFITIVQGIEFVGEVFKGGQGEGYTAEE